MRLAASSTSEDPLVLRDRLVTDGYLYFRDVISEDVLEALRTAARRAAVSAQLLSPEGRLARSDVRTATQRSVAHLCHDSEFRRARYAPSIRALVRAVGAGHHHPAPHAAFARFVSPRDQGARMASHQDRHFLSKPTEFVTVWIPVLMPRGGGGIALAPGSHTHGRVEHTAGAILREPSRWGSADYRAGDAVVFSGYTIHKSLGNHARSLRVSVDFRYVLDRPLR